MGGRWPVGASIDKKKFHFSHFLGFFRFQLCRVSGTRQRLCRVPDKKHSAKLALPSLFFCECCSPSVTLGEPFAECFRWFAECFGHSANSSSPVVWRLILRGGGCEAEKQCDGSIGGLVPCSRSTDKYGGAVEFGDG